MFLDKEKIKKFILSLYEAGFVPSEISEELEISVHTVKNYIKRNIRTREDFAKIKALHEKRKKHRFEIEKLNRHIRRCAEREIDNRLKKSMNTEQLVINCKSAYRTTKNGVLHYKYDESTRPMDLPRKYIPIVR